MKLITENAKNLIATIANEVRRADKRATDKWIKPSQVDGAILEALSAMGRRNIDMLTFLTTVSFIPKEEDIDPDVEWAEDPREPGSHEVWNAVTNPEHHRTDNGEICEHPLVGERVC
jgi:hypothetical protein